MYPGAEDRKPTPQPIRQRRTLLVTDVHDLQRPGRHRAPEHTLTKIARFLSDVVPYPRSPHESERLSSPGATTTRKTAI